MVLLLPASPSLQASLFLCLLLGLSFCVEKSSAAAKTPAAEVNALNTILGRWGKPASVSRSVWNISGEPCNGAAIDATIIDNDDFNPGIKCDCTYQNKTVCHITKLKVYNLNVVGAFPAELQNLTYLNNLNLAENYISGPLPGFIGNFPRMEYLSIGKNALSGAVPKELGKLQNLISLGMDSLNFSGSLPPELGNLTNLQKLYIDSSGVSGEFPSALSKLQNLQILEASNLDFTGNMPEFIGSLTNLVTLKLQGNSFQGPIPSSFSNLTQLTDLRIGDFTNGSSSLEFISNLTSLSTLILRNAKISDTIPSDFKRYSSLQILDLSFNNITGQLPQSLFNLSILTHLFLGNNSISGSLPTGKRTSLANIDLSYNQLSGNFPSWVGQKNLQLNLVANNFEISSSNNSGLSVGLNCLQRDIPCYRSSPVYSSFAIKCGGSSVRASDGTVYDTENATLTTASFYVTDQNKWAVSSVGSFADATTSNYIITSTSQFQNTGDSGLFQTARLSPSSLRYYGLGLENGNYSVKLQFAEIALLDGQTWHGVGRRIFDIYVQGKLQEKDFDIRKEAGGSFKAIARTYIASVTDNFLEIHFFWAGKGTCCVPYQSYYGPSISAISVSPYDFTPTVSNKPPSTSSSNKTGLVAGVVVAIGVLGLLAVVGAFIWRQRKKKLHEEDDELLEMGVRPDTFSYAELRTATNDFDSTNKLGEGGFGPVFKGTLSDGRKVAVKQLSSASHQGKRQFMAEIATISAVQHRNLVKLYGCCIEGDKRILVYEYLEHSSLDQALFGKSNLHLDWPTRFEICLGTARGLAYLHEESRVRVIHRDVKASNILLDADLNAKISDFGLAKLYDDKKTHISTRVAGTIGYLAPEYALRGHLTEKADVFGFGVVALEILCGRPNSDTTLDADKVYLLEWAWHMYENKQQLELVDPKLSSYNEEEVIRLLGVALLCTQTSPIFRPPMSRVVAMLAGDIEVGEVTSKPSYLTEWQVKDMSKTFTAEFSGDSGSMSNSQNALQPSISMKLSTPASPSQPLPFMQDSLGEGR